MIKTIKGKFLLAYVSLVIITITVLSVIFGNISINTSVESTISYSFEIAELQAKSISTKLENHISALSLITDSNESKNLDTDYIVSHINDLKTSEHYLFRDVVYITSDSSVFTDSFTDKISTGILSLFPEEKRPYSRKYVISGPLTLENSLDPVIAISVPVYSNKNILAGVLTGTITLKDISKELERDLFNHDFYAMITDANGFVIAHPDFDFHDKINMRNLKPYGIIDVDNSANDIITLPRGVVELYDEDYDEDNVYIFVSIPKTPNWKLGILTVQDDLLETTYILFTKFAVWGLFIMIVTIFLTTKLTSKVTAPILQIAKAVKDSRPINIMDIRYLSKSSEIDTFISSYNQMLMSLKKHTHNLEEIVEERTRELNLANQKLHSLATTDSLTKIINRNQIYEELFSLKKAADEDPPKPFSILFIDLNNFKYYNDNFGHDIGDNILIEIAKRVKKLIGEKDTVGRYGGDEFVIILPDTCIEDAAKLSKHLISEIAKMNGFISHLKKWLKTDKIEVPDKKKIGLSIGYACYDNDYNNIDQLIKDADEKMYEMKKELKKV